MPPKYHISKTEGPTRTKQFAKVPFELQSRTWDLTSESTLEPLFPSGLRASDDDEVAEEEQEVNGGTQADRIRDSTIGSKEPVRTRGGLASAAARRSAPSTGAMRRRSREGDDSDNESGHYPSESEESEEEGEEGEEEEESVSKAVLPHRLHQDHLLPRTSALQASMMLHRIPRTILRQSKHPSIFAMAS